MMILILILCSGIPDAGAPAPTDNTVTVMWSQPFPVGIDPQASPPRAMVLGHSLSTGKMTAMRMRLLSEVEGRYTFVPPAPLNSVVEAIVYDAKKQKVYFFFAPFDGLTLSTHSEHVSLEDGVSLYQKGGGAFITDVYKIDKAHTPHGCAIVPKSKMAKREITCTDVVNYLWGG